MPASTVSGSRARQVMPGAGAVTPAPVIIELTVGDFEYYLRRLLSTYTDALMR